MNNQPRSRISRTFTSMKTGLFLLAVIILFSIAGTIIPQERTLSTAGPIFRFFYYTLNLGDIYHSWWFSFLLFSLCLNIAVCSFSRLPALFKSTFFTPPWLPSIAWQQEHRLNASPDEAMGLLSQTLDQAGFRVWDVTPYRICARKGQLAPWGTFLVHLSVLFIALGAFYGSITGFRYTIQMAPGDSIVIGAGEHSGAGRPFTLTLQSFTIEHYSNGQISDWISTLEIVQNEKKEALQAVKVNHPLSYQGISFYQSSYASLYPMEQRSAGRTVQAVRLQEKEPYIVDEQQGIAVVPIKYLPDFDAQNPMVSRSANPVNPHVIYLAYAGGRPLGMNAIAIGKPLLLPGSSAEVIFHSVLESSGLEVKYDPGLPLVFAGFALMSLAFFASLYPRRRIVYAQIRPDGDAACLSISLLGKSQLPEEELSRLCKAMIAAAEETSTRRADRAKL
ncbi:MAG: Cytochrome c biosis protein ResB [Firmicutes bacterium]|nr:Cytochrome c biosis protein ResB [Bacillota bacterium]